MFKRKSQSGEQSDADAPLQDGEAGEEEGSLKSVCLFGLEEEEGGEIASLPENLAQQIPGHRFFLARYDAAEDAVRKSQAAVVFFSGSAERDRVLDAVRAERRARGNGLPVLIVVVDAGELTELGEWLMKHAKDEQLEGIRLVSAENVFDATAELSDKLAPIFEPSVLSMPSSPEVENSPLTYFFAISPQIRKTVRTIGELAENNVERMYLLGGPGSGKTSLAYYYWLKRQRGRFIAVNLNAESSGDKDAMKSLLCGHVTGAFPGASSREGAFSYADGGVAFLDESHGVTGVVMQVLMEALDSGQYLPFGATKKRQLDCAVIFASNRSWEQLRSQIDLDEHARLGATIVPVHDLVVRREDLIAGVAVALARFKSKCTNWRAPRGLTGDAWRMILSCPWSGNVRTLFRVMETSLVSYALAREETELLDGWEVQEGLNLWEPPTHHSQKLYTSYR